MLTPAAGDAVAFYNYHSDVAASSAGDGTGAGASVGAGAGGVALDRLALHAGLPAPSERRVAALWFRVAPGQGTGEGRSEDEPDSQ